MPASTSPAAGGRPAAARGHRPFAAALVVLAGLALPAPARADWHLAPFAGVKFGGSTTLIDLDDAAGDKKLVYGATVTWLGRGIVGVEGDLGVVPNYLEADTASKVQASQVSTLMGNVVVTAPLGWTRESLRPYASGGAGLVRVTMEDSVNVFNYRRNLGGYNIGGGVVGFLTPFTGVKWDVRYFRAWGPAGEGTTFGSARLNFWRATMAIVFRY